MTNSSADRIRQYLDERIDLGDFPSAVFVLREYGHDTIQVACGDAVVTPERIPATVETIYDLASLSKCLSTTLLTCMLVEEGAISLDDHVTDHLPEFDWPNKQEITIRHLLVHTSGLPKWWTFYITPGDPELVLDTIGQMPLIAETGSRVVYSDPNFITLGILVERIAGACIGKLFAERIAGPLGLETTSYNPAPSLRPRIAATEIGNAHERAIAGAGAGSYENWRTHLLWGEVHDGNCHFLGGCAGHAGLFGTASEVATIAEQFLPGSRLLRCDETFALFRTNFSAELDSHRSIGWMLASAPESSAGPALPDDAFGHTGFTGTSVWVDPHTHRVFVLLTNRTHPVYNDPPMTAIRKRVHELACGG